MIKQGQEVKKRITAGSFGDMPRRPSLFWDVDPEIIDPKKHARYIIERILEFGKDDELRWLVHYYPPKVIKDTLRKSRGVFHKKTKTLWEIVYQ